MTPLVLITGFPGSGRIAFLKAVIPALREGGWSPSVIVNDLDNAQGIADSLSSELGGRVIPIGGTCISRDGVEPFFNALAETPTADNSILLVVASPIAETTDLLESLTIEPRASAFSRPIQVAAVDAMRWQRRDEANHLEGMQVITAPYLLINRLGELKEARRKKVAGTVLGLNPYGEVISVEEFPGKIADLLGLEDSGNPSDHHFSTLTFPLKQVVSREDLSALLNSLPREVIRAKGIARLADTPDRSFLFQKIDGVKDIEFLELEEGAEPDPLMIAIGPAMPSAVIREKAAELSLTP